MGRYLLLLLASAVALAQSPTATLVGDVKDPTGAAVPGAEIRVRNTATNDVRTTRSTDLGQFTVVNLLPGVYEVTAQNPGFQKLVETGIELFVDQTARVSLSMRVGDVSESVEVTAALAPLNTENATKGEVIVSQEMQEMPLNGRDFTDLAYLVPGVVPKAEVGQSGGMNINGARADNVNYLVDGFNGQDPRLAGPAVRPPLDSMQEFKMQTANYSAEYGRHAGGVMNMVLKSGGNRVHGALFEFLRNDVFDARGFFDKDKSRLRRNQFGATLSGPVYVPKLYNGRDRTFFLFSWEHYEQTMGSSRLARTATLADRAGDFSTLRDANGRALGLTDPLAKAPFPGNIIPASRFSPVSVKILPYYLLPNRPDDGNNFQASALDTDISDDFVGKIDQRLGQRHTVSFRSVVRLSSAASPFQGSDLGSFGQTLETTPKLWGLSYTFLASNSVVNEARSALTRMVTGSRSPFTGRDMNTELGMSGGPSDPKLWGFPKINVTSYVSLGEIVGVPQDVTLNGWQFADTLTWVRSRHTLKVGVDVLRNQVFDAITNNTRGTYAFLGRWTNATFGDFLLGLLNSASRQVNLVKLYMYQTNAGFFGQDDFKLTPRLTLNLGLRYEQIRPLTEKNGRIGIFVPELNKIVISDGRTVPDLERKIAAASLTGRVITAQEAGLPVSVVRPDNLNFAPRFGFAWRGGWETALRGGYGIFYGNTIANAVRVDLFSAFPFSASETYPRNANNPNLVTLSAPFPSSILQGGGVQNAGSYPVDARTPYLQSWNLTVEKGIGRGSAIETAYVGSKGTHLGRRYDLNQPFRGPQYPGSPRPYPGLAAINYDSFASDSAFHAGVISMRRRFANRVFYRANYQFSKSTDDASQFSNASVGGYTGAQDSRNLSLEHARSDFDIRHTLTSNFSVETPARLGRALGGWQIAGTGTAYSGRPFTVRVGAADLNLGEANRPDRIRNGKLDNPTPQRWYDLAAFPVVPPGAFRFGNSGRNVLDGPGRLTLNGSLSKRIRIRESHEVQIRWEVFNAINHANFMLPVNDIDSPAAGTLTQAQDGRLMQFGIRYQF
jgi:outer membrane receptor protein involved in Fe transport